MLLLNGLGASFFSQKSRGEQMHRNAGVDKELFL